MTVPSAPAAASPDIGQPPGPGNGGRSRVGSRALRLVLFASGLAALTALLTLVGWHPIVENLSRIGGYFAVLLALYALPQLAFTAGWWTLIGRPHPVGFGELFSTYLAGDSVNYFTGVGGDPVKAHLLAGKMGFGMAFATVAVNRHADVLAQWLFLVAGAGIALTHFTIPTFARVLVIAGLLVLGALVLGFTTAMRRGFFGPFLRKLSQIRALTARLRRFEDEAHRLDDRIRRYYHEEEHRGRFAVAVGWGVLGWCGGLLETYLILRLLSPESGLPQAVAIETLSMILNSILLFVPGRIGTAEGVRVGVASLVGLTPAQGAAYALARRARELVWLAPGIIVLLKRHVLDVGQMRLESMDSEVSGS